MKLMPSVTMFPLQYLRTSLWRKEMSCQTYGAGRRSSWMTLRYWIWNLIWPGLISEVLKAPPIFFFAAPSYSQQETDRLDLAAVAWMQPLLSGLICVYVWSGGTNVIPSCLCSNPQTLWTLMVWHSERAHRTWLFMCLCRSLICCF